MHLRSARSSRSVRAVAPARWLSAALGLGGLLAAGPAAATTALEIPDNGSEAMGRGGAWVARASDPLAAFYNPAGLAGQDTRLLLNANVTFSHTCFTRVLAAGDTTQDPYTSPGGTMPRVCNDVAPGLNPQLGFTWRINDRVGLGVLPILAPASVPTQTWPEFDADGRPSPQRYLLLKSEVVYLMPTIGVGVEVADGLRLGASFQWGIVGKARFQTAAPALNADNTIPRENDIKADLFTRDLFVPGFTLGVLYSATDALDVAGWYKWSAPIDARGDIVTSARYFTADVARGNNTSVPSDSSQRDCGTGQAGDTRCGDGDNARVKVPIPMEAKLGVRFHKASRAARERASGPLRASHRRDPMHDDAFDVELDLTWANNSAFKDLEVRFPGDANANGVIPVNGTPGTVPPNADVPHRFKDVLGVRLGGDWNALPDRLALRAGAFFETAAQDAQFQNLDFPGTTKVGLSLGGTYRIALGDDGGAGGAGPARSLDVSLGYGHVFIGTSTNDDPRAAGIPALAGTPCNGGGVATGGVCDSGRQAYRTSWPVNLGTITNSVNVFNVGVAYRF